LILLERDNRKSPLSGVGLLYLKRGNLEGLILG
jgi:hypothetical protein